ncbi:MAG: NADH:flavin oxidoreductase [Deltaproteobacteria bacterium]|nr:NADH:flavin oxidoreductase [Deltaproteobacteria bacterium]
MSRQAYAIFSEGTIGRLKVKNRLVRAATNESAMTKDGHITEKMLTLYKDLAQGGVGTIITGHMAVELRGKGMPRQSCIYDDGFIEEIAKIADTIHHYGNGCKAIAQLSFAGRQVTHENNWAQSLGPSEVISPVTKKQARALSREEIGEIIQAFVQAIARVQRAGFDGVQLHAAHGYLLSAFLSPYTNHRTDQYGGSLGNRVRIISEIVAQARAQVGDFPILIKFNCDDHVPGGIDFDSFPALAREIEKTGVDAIEVSGGMWDCLVRTESELGFVPVPIPESRTDIATPEKQSYYLRYVDNLKLSIPILLIGGNRDIERMERILAQGTVSFFSLARPLISEPNLPQRWLEGRGPATTHCISCNACVFTIKHASVTCLFKRSKTLQKIVHGTSPLAWHLFLK